MTNTLVRSAGRFFRGKSRVSTATLQRWHIVAAVLLAVQAIVLWLLGNPYPAPVYLWHMTGDALQTKLRGAPVTAPAAHVLWRPDLTLVVALALLITAIALGLLVAVFRGRYESKLKPSYVLSRWLVMIVAGAAVMVTLCLAAGLSTFTDIMTVVLSLVIAGLASASIELQASRGNGTLARLLAGIAGIAAGVPLLAVLLTLASTAVFGSLVVPAGSWIAFVLVAAGWLLVAGNMWLSRARRGKWGTFLYAEVWYAGLVLVLEMVLAWELFATVLHP